MTVTQLFQAVARIGANLCCLYDEAEEQEKFLSVITDAEWGIKLSKLEVFGLKLLSIYVYISPTIFPTAGTLMFH